MITKSNYNLPPGPSPLPIIENLLELGHKPHKSLAKLVEIHGPIMSLKFGQITTIIVSSTDMEKEVYTVQTAAYDWVVLFGGIAVTILSYLAIAVTRTLVAKATKRN
ncbi:unnamed protein product [Vicia faba]|uniref:Uncharacterized protein n=1 Tax=Vicia faba TaxID=3906 RepID=A0AAV0Z4E5_VICFA|nr:unnamed protein product [Vicia faba]